MAVDISLRQAGQPGDRLKQLTLGMALFLRLGDVTLLHLRQGRSRYPFVVRKRCHGLNLDRALRSPSLMGQRCS